MAFFRHMWRRHDTPAENMPFDMTMKAFSEGKHLFATFYGMLHTDLSDSTLHLFFLNVSAFSLALI